ncbi:MAG: CAP domain-containing protein [Candidatus Korobacteraceae bacterium]
MPREKLASRPHPVGALLWLALTLAMPIHVGGSAADFLATQPPQANAPTPPAQQGQFDTAGEAQLVDLINQARTNEGLAPLTVDQRLTRAAQKHTQLMVKHAELSHQFDGEPAMQRRFADEEMRSGEEGENVALNQTVAGAHQALMDSPPHRHNILDPEYNTIGVGIMRRGGNVYVTEDFAQRLPEYSEPQAEAVVQRAIEREARSTGITMPVRRVEPQLRSMACGMALNDKLNNQAPAQLAGVQEVLIWTAGDPGKPPDRLKKRLRQPLPSGYALGACFAPSVSHPGGVYWIVMVMY